MDTTKAATPLEVSGEATGGPVVVVEKVTVSYRAGKKVMPVLVDVDLTVAPGEIVAVVGESGCGKSTLAGALVGHLRAGSKITQGRVLIGAQDLFRSSGPTLRRIRSGTVAFVPQNAGHALTPSMRVGDQIGEVLRFGRGMDRAAARAEAIRLFGLVRLPEPEQLLARYPHQLSGGQLQRVAIAIGIAGSPRLLVMDEPTTGLDVVTQAGILALLADLRATLGVAIVLVSHDLGAVARLCDRMLVMYSGRVVEAGPTAELFAAPAHPYTRGLLASVPRISAPGLPVGMTGGSPVGPGTLPGCAFAPRCPFAQEACTHDPAPALATRRPLTDGRVSACLRTEHVLDQPVWTSQVRPREHREFGPVLLQVRGLQVDYRAKPDAATGPTVDGIDLEVRQGEVVALVGESGSGKSTIAWTLAGLRRPTAGELTLHPRQAGTTGATADLTLPAAKRAPQWRRQVQLIFQNADTSLNPRRSVGDAVARPLRLLGLRGQKATARRDEVFADVGLPTSFADRLPAQLSGGQRQRAGIARALAADPALLLADEVVSALDVSVQASVLGLLDDLRAEHQLGYLFIGHDLAVVRGLADRVVVLYLGRICEEGTVEDVFGVHGAGAVNHPYTRLLLDSVMDPVPTATARVAAPRTRADEPESAPPPAGCPFYRRCELRIEGTCNTQAPPVRQPADRHRIRCHLPLTDLNHPGELVDAR
ncbi:peptide/nickel transport system ATP-binding protein [Nakamurella panacisegetis]|uniref:Peptide/nickel transport system ATP-binding protein n=1 Tax=Nakamurella panacisegetis TaxID=1090615 RepID=A0A1H0N703_9ACTN|nr:dipeptide ABC transporter ATP-binding protein [Nakamurella panacisegetis]SDO88296.1 peptide/nickel transport system ATP-binding protein [Nakamurella panacisegetis]